MDPTKSPPPPPLLSFPGARAALARDEALPRQRVLRNRESPRERGQRARASPASRAEIVVIIIIRPKRCRSRPLGWPPSPHSRTTSPGSGGDANDADSSLRNFRISPSPSHRRGWRPPALTHVARRPRKQFRPRRNFRRRPWRRRLEPLWCTHRQPDEPSQGPLSALGDG